MMMLSGYTLGFFFPKQVKHLAASAGVAAVPTAPKIEIEPRNLNETRPDADFESREVPAAFYFYRYF
jgi:hypothetical protein